MKLFKKMACLPSRVSTRIALPCLILIIAPLFPMAIGTAYRGPVVKETEDGSSSFILVRSIGNKKYVINKKESVVTWKGSNQAISAGDHQGYINISNGELILEKDQLVGGTVEVDMNTIQDELHGSQNNLIRHLKSPDFFDVEKFPFSTFAITRVESADYENIKVTGNLTIKGITHAVTFPAKIDVKGRVVKADGELHIDRTQWDVRYRSGRFFDNLADGVISDSIEFKFKIVAKK